MAWRLVAGFCHVFLSVVSFFLLVGSSRSFAFTNLSLSLSLSLSLISLSLSLSSMCRAVKTGTMTCASGGVNSSLLYAKPQSSAKGSRAHLQQDMFSFTPDRNTTVYISCQPLDGSGTFQDDTPIRYVDYRIQTYETHWRPPQMKNPSRDSELLTDS